MTVIEEEHYCKLHQGNYSHYAAENCTVCKLTHLVQQARLALECIIDLREGALRETCPDCEPGCNHGATMDSIIHTAQGARDLLWKGRLIGRPLDLEQSEESDLKKLEAGLPSVSAHLRSRKSLFLNHCQIKPTCLKLFQKLELMPTSMSKGASGFDLKARLLEPVTLKPGEWEAIPCGFSMAIEDGFEAQVRPRSGLALKHGITVLNSPGTIDSDYRGEVKVILINHGKEPYVINAGDRIAQLVFKRLPRTDFSIVEELKDSKRGSGGFGSTGK